MSRRLHAVRQVLICAMRWLHTLCRLSADVTRIPRAAHAGCQSSVKSPASARSTAARDSVGAKASMKA